MQTRTIRSPFFVISNPNSSTFTDDRISSGGYAQIKSFVLTSNSSSTPSSQKTSRYSPPGQSVTAGMRRRKCRPIGKRTRSSREHVGWESLSQIFCVLTALVTILRMSCAVSECRETFGGKFGAWYHSSLCSCSSQSLRRYVRFLSVEHVYLSW